jgi:hypothetical protein
MLGFVGPLLNHAGAQNLTLEGQTGGFITPTGYTLQARPGQWYSRPAVGYHFIDASAVIGTVSTLNVTEGFFNRAEIGYTRLVHTNGGNLMYSPLWYFSGMDIVHAKVNVIKENSFGQGWVPAVAIGGVYRIDDNYVTGAIYNKVEHNGDVYVAVTKQRLKAPIPVLVNLGFKCTNASIYGIGGNATRFQGRFFGGVGFPLPGPFGLAIVPAAGFTQEPHYVEGLPGAKIPTTLDYAVRITQSNQEKDHFSFDIGVGQVAGKILPTVDLQARSVFGMGLSYKF